MALKKDSKQIYKPSTEINKKKQEVIEQNSENLDNISFDPRDIKNRYIFPFN